MSASKKLALAMYKYNDLDEQTKRLEKRYVPKKVREQAAVVGAIVNAVIEQKVSWRWEF